MNAEPLLRTEAASFGRVGRVVLRHVDLVIHPGDRVALVGPNGSGKTTLLRGMLGLDLPLAGSTWRRSPLRIGYVPQRDTLDPWYPLSGFDVALLGTYADVPPWRGIGAAERGRAHEALARCRAEGLASRRYGELSGGERQRVLVARALASRPDLLLLDEPTAGIDAEAEAQILRALDDVHRESRVAIWIVTHHPTALRGRVDRVATIEGSALVFREAA